MRALSFLLVLSVALPTASGCAHYKLLDGDELNEHALRRMERETAYARGLAFKRPVGGAVLDGEEVENGRDPTDPSDDFVTETFLEETDELSGKYLGGACVGCQTGTPGGLGLLGLLGLLVRRRR